jgi:hypothetical protein
MSIINRWVVQALQKQQQHVLAWPAPPRIHQIHNRAPSLVPQPAENNTSFQSINWTASFTININWYFLDIRQTEIYHIEINVQG